MVTPAVVLIIKIIKFNCTVVLKEQEISTLKDQLNAGFYLSLLLLHLQSGPTTALLVFFFFFTFT